MSDHKPIQPQTASAALNKKPQPFYVVKFKLIVFVLILIIILPGYYLLIKPQYLKYKSNLAIFNRLEKELRINLKQLNSNKKIILDYQSINQLDKDKIDYILPNKPDIANLYVNLQAVAQKNNLTLTNLSINPLKTIEKKIIFPKQESKQINKNLNLIANVEINLELESVSYAKMKKLFYDLETNLRLLDILNFEFSPSDGSLSLFLHAYHLKN